eukprot:gene4499-15451_t
MSFLIETGRAFQPPADEMRAEVARVWPGIEYYLNLPTPIEGHILDASSGAGIEATIQLPDLGFSYDEGRQSTPGTGRYGMWVPAGSHRLAASAPGYATTTVTVQVGQGTTIQDIRLSPAR